MVDFFQPDAQPSQVQSFDLAIIGAGPAGMSAALTACEHGANVAVINDKPAAGGQIYRNVTTSPLPNSALLGEEYTEGAALVERYNHCSATKFDAANVWHIGDDGEILFSHAGGSHTLQAKQVIIATGAMERPFPIPGWHLPGVMSAGSAQVMLKSDALVSEDAVFIGTGPLLYLIVAQYLRLGVKVKAVIDTTQSANYVSALAKGLQGLTKPKMLLKGLSLIRQIRASGTAFYSAVEALKIESREGRASAVSFSHKGQCIELQAEQFFLHQGVIPNLNATRALGIDHHWSEQQLCWQPSLDKWGCSNLPHIAVAGDSSGIVGADGAKLSGELAALNSLHKLELLSEQRRDALAASAHIELSSLNRFRQFIDRLYRPRQQHRVPEDESTVVCRCEEQTMGQLKQGFELGAKGPNELKGMTRCGMGPCQGRMCGTTVSELLGHWRNQNVAQVGYYRLRSPMRLLSLLELSQFKQVSATQSQADSVVSGGKS